MQALCKVLEILVEGSTESTLVVDNKGTIVGVSQLAAELLGQSKEVLIPSAIDSLLPGCLISAKKTLLAGESQLPGIIEIPHTSNSEPLSTNVQRTDADELTTVRISVAGFNVENKEYIALVLSADANSAIQNTLRTPLASLPVYIDGLTGLANRTLAIKWLHDCMAAVDDSSPLDLLYIDLNDFKLVNNALGRKAGDCLLCEIACRLHSKCIDNDKGGSQTMIARVDGDAFLIAIRKKADPLSIRHFTDEILLEMKKPLLAGDETIYISASIGVSRCTKRLDPQLLISQAEVAMNSAKHPFNASCQHYSADLSRRNRERLTLECCLHDAVDQTEFNAFYQPQLSVENNEYVGSEALLRWHSKILGSVSPTVFVPLLESRGLIVNAGFWILAHACNTQRNWLKHSPHSTVSVNLSSQQLHHKNFIPELRQLLKESRLAPEKLVLELTESILLDDSVDESRVLYRIKDMGVTLALDDFGTGYGTFSHLKNQPIDQIKIDRSFITDLMYSKKNRAITTSIIDLAHKLGKTVTAEGVDSSAILHFLKKRGCHHYQGYLGSVPLPADSLARKFILTDHAANPEPELALDV